MARIPTADALGEPQISAGRGGDIDTSSMRALAAEGQAFGNLGQSLARVGAVIGEQQNQEDDYEIRKQFIDLDLETEKQFDEAKRSVSGDASGFTEGLRKSYDERAKAFFANVPAHLKPKYNEHLVQRGASFEKRAFDHELVTRDRFHVDDLTSRFDTLYGATTDRPDSYRENIARGVSLIDASRVPAAAKLRMKKTFAEEVERIHAERQLDTPEGAERVLQDLKRFPRGMIPAEEGKATAPQGAAPMSTTGPRKPFAKPIEDAISTAATKAGVDVGMLRTFAKIESGGDPSNITGSYKGLFQLSNEEFKRHGGSGDIMDPLANALAAAQKLKAESQQFEKQFGRTPSAAELYMVHQQGVAGSAAHWKNPDKPAWENMLSTGEGRHKGEGWAKQAIWGNVPSDVKKKFGSVDNLTSKDFIKLWDSKVAALGGGSIAATAAPAAADERQKISLAGLDDAGKAAKLEELVASGYQGIVHQLDKDGNDVLVARKQGKPGWFKNVGPKAGAPESEGDLADQNFAGPKWAGDTIKKLRDGSLTAAGAKDAAEPEFAEGKIPTGEVKVAEATGAPVKTDASMLAAGEFEENDAAPYRHLSPKARRALIYKAENTLRAGLDKIVGDDIERIRRTGAPTVKDGEENSLERAKRMMKGAPQQYAKLEAQWKEADMEYKAISPLMRMPTDAAREFVGRIVSAADDGSESYRSAVRVQKKAEATLNKIIDLRTKDAAQSVSGYKDDVDRYPPLDNTKTVMMVLSGPNKANYTPQQAHDMLFQARLADQKTINPDKPYEHRIITAREADKLLAMPSPSTMKPREYRDKLEEAAARAEQWYGSKWSERALKEAIALQRGGRNDELKQQESKILARIASGGEVDPEEERRWIQLYEMDKQRKGWLGQADIDVQAPEIWQKPTPVAPAARPADITKTPNKAQADWLMADPEKRSETIDKHFGQGAAAKIIGSAQKKQAPAAPAR